MAFFTLDAGRFRSRRGAENMAKSGVPALKTRIGVDLVRRANTGLLTGRPMASALTPPKVTQVVRQARFTSQQINEAGRRALKAHKPG